MSNFERRQKQLGNYLQRVNIAFGSMVAISIVVLAGMGGLAYFSASRGKAQTSQILAQTVTLKDEIKRADVSDFALISTTPVEDFQGMLEAACEAHRCKMGEFQASSDWTPFLSRFAKNSDDPGWTQTQIQLTLTGSTASIVNTLRSVISKTVLFEFDSVDFAPIEADKSERKVMAKISLRILKKENV
jgi:hypothetical protein